MAARTVLSVALGCATAAAAYTWPDPRIDAVETILYEHSSGQVRSIAVGVQGCGLTPGDLPRTGRTNSAEWLRTAYHDMATADVAAGTGGIDASISFETDRGENLGKAFAESFNFFAPFQSPGASMSDLIALGALQAVASCSNGSIIVPFRAGRIDANGAGPTGVPEPQEDLATHTSKFSRQGFNTTEMIGLVACGHTLGGVHGNDFPTIVDAPNDPATDDNRVDFDASPAVFDNSVATQFVNNETQNPLAFGRNETTRSDFRIFGADGGVYIRRMAEDPAFFNAQCLSLFERMLNTVPANVELTKPIAPIPVKPRDVKVAINTDGTLSVSGQLRVIEDGKSTTARNVTVEFKARDGTPSFSVAASLLNGNIRNIYPNSPSFSMYFFTTTANLSTGISSFNVKAEEGGNVVFLNDNGGAGFPTDDHVVQQLSRSCTVGSGNPSAVWGLNITLAVRDDFPVSDLKLSVSFPVAQNNSIVPAFQTTRSTFTKTSSLTGTGYSLWSAGFRAQGSSQAAKQKLYYDILGTGPNGAFTQPMNPWANAVGSCS
ncbi:heme peroxidase [Thozetella sp. PMI_491]|nr:heme peroxidase [Thozetella sp. PMI_491]